MKGNDSDWFRGVNQKGMEAVWKGWKFCGKNQRGREAVRFGVIVVKGSNFREREATSGEGKRQSSNAHRFNK